MSHKIKLIYFDLTGRGEPIRWAFLLGGIEFEDFRMTFPEWAELKPSTPWGAVPALEVDGTIFGQSNSQLRFAGKLAGLYPADNLLALKVDELLDAVEDFIEAISPTLREQDSEKRLSLRKNLAEKYYPEAFANLEKVLERNGSSPFAIGSEITIADLKLTPFLNWFKTGTLDGIPDDIADHFPRVVALREATNNHPKIVEWTAAHNRPQI